MPEENRKILYSGIIIGVIASLLVLFGNPVNMGFCIACFLRDTAGALGLHRAAAVQYIRPEIIGIVLGSFLVAVKNREFQAKGGSSPLIRFCLGFFAMVGSLMFLGCPFRMIIRLAGGDLNAIMGIIGFTVGIAVGIGFLNRGYSLGRTYRQAKLAGAAFPLLQVLLFGLLLLAPAFIFFTKAGGGPGGKHAAIIISLAAGGIVGLLAQQTRFCMVGGIRDYFLFRDKRLLLGGTAVLVSCLVCNVVLTAVTGTAYFKLGFIGQSIAHTDGVWNFLGMLLTGFSCVLLGGCPLRQLVLAGEGNSDSAGAVLGLVAGAAFAHNFGVASSGAGPTINGKIAVMAGILLTTVIAYWKTRKNR